MLGLLLDDSVWSVSRGVLALRRLKGFYSAQRIVKTFLNAALESSFELCKNQLNAEVVQLCHYLSEVFLEVCIFVLGTTAHQASEPCPPSAKRFGLCQP